MAPANTVSHTSHDARLNGERIIAPVVIGEYPQHRPDNEVPIIADGTASHQGKALLMPETVRQLKQENTQQLLKSNYWFEMASIARWCTTALIALTAASIVGAAGLTAEAAAAMSFGQVVGALGAAITGAPVVLAAMGALAIAATATVLISQHSRKVFVEKSFDVQDTLMQRQAQLVGKSVEEAVQPQYPQPAGDRWATRTQASLEHAQPQQASL